MGNIVSNQKPLFDILLLCLWSFVSPIGPDDRSISQTAAYNKSNRRFVCDPFPVNNKKRNQRTSYLGRRAGIGRSLTHGGNRIPIIQAREHPYICFVC
jgi:hypothetical protein